MRRHLGIRGHSVSHKPLLRARKSLTGMEQPGAFQCMLLRAFELPKMDRDVFLLKQVHGHSPAKIAAILGISVETVLARLETARHAIGRFDNSGAIERAR